MFNSLFIITKNGNVIIEKHYRSVVSRGVVEHFLGELGKEREGGGDLVPVLAMPRQVLIHIQRHDLFYLSVVTAEVPPLFVIEFLHRVADVFQEYFNDVSELSIKDNFLTVYQLLEELMDSGFPLTTEPSILKEMIDPPSVLNRAVNAVTGGSSVQSQLPTGTMSSIPWRKVGVKHTSNEIYIDIIEEIDAIIENNGSIVSCEIQGKVMCNCKLSGMPDLTLVFVNPRILEDVRFHPCVRLNRFEREKVLSFVPPDGQFELMRYRVNTGGNTQLPIYVKPQVFFSQGSGKFGISVGTKNAGGKPVENLVVTMPLPSNVTSVSANPNHGSFQFDQSAKKLKWTIGRIPKEKLPMLDGNASFQPGTHPEGNPVLSAEFKINLFSVSGLKVDTLVVTGENYKPYKGVRSITQSGKFQIRT